MEPFKYVLLVFVVLFQLIGIVSLFFDWRLAVGILIAYAVLLIGLFVILIMERKKEKREEDEDDYRHY